MKTEFRSIQLFEVVYRGETLLVTLNPAEADDFAYKRNCELKNTSANRNLRFSVFVTEFSAMTESRRLPVMRRQAELHVA